ncbi:hypothetical protein OVS_02190 [Mycoplasma ovis str. Michigan]|uniref:Uncharacterized protein n=1 Tax=Mycoplasma ovis str. Michigan TaxID=1415773 RepID=A0ABM5P1F5_9MOLU|nr:hypothetical protein OVS_02190 [Mycoplasma ovis str. Michigan]
MKPSSKGILLLLMIHYCYFLVFSINEFISSIVNWIEPSDPREGIKFFFWGGSRDINYAKTINKAFL